MTGGDRVCDAVLSQGFEGGHRGLHCNLGSMLGDQASPPRGPDGGRSSAHLGIGPSCWAPSVWAPVGGRMVQEVRGGLRRGSQLPGAGRGDVGGPLLSLHTCSLVGFLGGSAAEYLPATVEAQVQSLGWVEPLGK